MYGLRPLAWLFAQAVRLRRQYWQRRQPYLPVPLVVVGNITLGGTGKTPLLIALVQFLQQQGLSVAVVSRGYGGHARKAAYPLQVTEHSDVALCGDEPMLIHHRTQALVMVDPQRLRAVQAVLALHPVDCIVSDDGLQHYAMPRDIEVVMLDAKRGLGNGRLLPEGPLREPVQRLQSVDFIISRQSCAMPALPSALQRLQRHYGVTIAQAQVQAAELVSACPDQALPDPQKPVYAVAGIAQPEAFFATLRALGYRQVQGRAFADHHRFSAQDLHRLSEYPIIMTEKDWVKCQRWAPKNVFYLPIHLHIDDWVLPAVYQRIVQVMQAKQTMVHPDD